MRQLIKIVIILVALLVALLILRPLLALVMGVGFWFVRVLLMAAFLCLVAQIIGKIFFKIDLFSYISRFFS